jgi:hypothetical protein
MEKSGVLTDQILGAYGPKEGQPSIPKFFVELSIFYLFFVQKINKVNYQDYSLQNITTVLFDKF